jgi:hypothetical protein
LYFCGYLSLFVVIEAHGMSAAKDVFVVPHPFRRTRKGWSTRRMAG